MISSFKLGPTGTALFRVVSANALVAIAGMFIAFIMPLALSAVDYGFWQLFSLYSQYAAIFMLGFNDGFHLNYAGVRYDHSTFLKFRSFRDIVIMLSLIGTGATVVLSVLASDPDRRFVVLAVAGYVSIVGLNGFSTYANQNTLRFKEYSRAIVLERWLFLILALGLLFLNTSSFRLFVVVSLLAGAGKLAYNMASTREVFFGRGIGVHKVRPEVFSNFSHGFVLMVSVILGNSVIAISRFVVEFGFGIATFGAFSFALTVMSVGNLAMASFSQVLFPVIRRVDNLDLERTMRLVGTAASALGAVLLISYYLVASLVLIAYTRYVEVLDYLAFLYPLVIFQGKYVLLVMNTLKIRRDTTWLLLDTLLGVTLSGTATYTVYRVGGSVYLIALAAVASYVGWYYASIVLLHRKLGWRTEALVWADLGISSAFLGSWLLALKVSESQLGVSLLVSCLIYSILLLAYFLIIRRYVRSQFRELIGVLAV